MGESIRYLLLTDFDHRGEIVRQEGQKFFLCSGELETRIGLGPYFYPDAPEFKCYEVITEEEAMKLISKI